MWPLLKTVHLSILRFLFFVEGQCFHFGRNHSAHIFQTHVLTIQIDGKKPQNLTTKLRQSHPHHIIYMFYYSKLTQHIHIYTRITRTFLRPRSSLLDSPVGTFCGHCIVAWAIARGLHIAVIAQEKRGHFFRACLVQHSMYNVVGGEKERDVRAWAIGHLRDARREP